MTTHADAEQAARKLAADSGQDWASLSAAERNELVTLASDEGRHALFQIAKSKLTELEYAAIVNAAKADAYRDVRRELVWNTEAYKTQVREIVHLSDELGDLVTASGGHYRKPSLSPRYPAGTFNLLEGKFDA